MEGDEVQAAKGHNCKICIKQPRKNQLLLHCCKCYDTYFKTCPVLLSKEIKGYDNLFRTWLKNKETWDCLECRKKLTNVYCTACHMDKDKILLECSWCKNKCHSDCAGNVKLGLTESSTDWLCKKCKGDKRTDWSAAAEASTKNAIVGVKELEDILKTEFYPYEGVKILQLNIGAQRLHKVKHFLLKNEKYVDVFGIGETNLNKNHSNEDYEISGYELIRCDKKQPLKASNKVKTVLANSRNVVDESQNNSSSTAQRNGGLLFYIRKDWKIVTKSWDFFENNNNAKKDGGNSSASENIGDTIEYLEVKIEKENKRLKGDSLCLLLILMYSPEPSKKAFMEKLEELLTQRIAKLKNINQVFIMGDTKINLLKSENPSRLGLNFKTIMTELGYSLLLDEDEPTVATKKTAKLTHVLYASEDNEDLGVRGGVVYLDWSSHYLVYGVKKYYFNQMPTLEAKTLKAFGFTNLSEHTTTKKERVMKAILDYAKAERQRLEDAKPQPGKIENGKLPKTRILSATKELLSEEIEEVDDNANLKTEENSLENGKMQSKGNGKLKETQLGRRKRFWFIPIWCSSQPL